ncbi:response regulator transcription factor [Paraburkholderia sediminicola]|uniref:response regulator transcription factor n=1 Tax=Paraburkholderia sediminicola TaxID=458836 RepID=UPI0038B963DB
MPYCVAVHAWWRSVPWPVWLWGKTATQSGFLIFSAHECGTLGTVWHESLTIFPQAFLLEVDRVTTTIAAVEDNPEHARLIGAVARRCGYTCEFFETGAAFFLALSNSQFHMILLDRELPDIDGIALLRRVCAHVGRSLPILFITGHSLEVDIVAGLSVGADDYIDKPVRTAELARPRAGPPTPRYGRKRVTGSVTHWCLYVQHQTTVDLAGGSDHRADR